jgi:hypothetical protein
MTRDEQKNVKNSLQFSDNLVIDVAIATAIIMLKETWGEKEERGLQSATEEASASRVKEAVMMMIIKIAIAMKNLRAG